MGATGRFNDELPSITAFATFVEGWHRLRARYFGVFLKLIFEGRNVF